MTPPSRFMMRFAIILNWVMGVFLVLIAVTGAVVDLRPDWFGIDLAVGDPVPFAPEILGILFVFGLVFLITARSLGELPLGGLLRLRSWSAKRRRMHSRWPYFLAKRHDPDDDPPSRERRSAVQRDRKPEADEPPS